MGFSGASPVTRMTMPVTGTGSRSTLVPWNSRGERLRRSEARRPSNSSRLQSLRDSVVTPVSSREPLDAVHTQGKGITTPPSRVEPLDTPEARALWWIETSRLLLVPRNEEGRSVLRPQSAIRSSKSVVLTTLETIYRSGLQRPRAQPGGTHPPDDWDPE